MHKNHSCSLSFPLKRYCEAFWSFQLVLWRQIKFLGHPNWLLSFSQLSWSISTVWAWIATDFLVNCLCLINSPFNSIADLRASFPHPTSDVLRRERFRIYFNVNFSFASDCWAVALVDNWKVKRVNSVAVQSSADLVDISLVHVFGSWKNRCWLAMSNRKFLTTENSRVVVVISHENFEQSVTRKNIERETNSHFCRDVIIFDLKFTGVWIAMGNRRQPNKIVLRQLLN